MESDTTNKLGGFNYCQFTNKMLVMLVLGTNRCQGAVVPMQRPQIIDSLQTLGRNISDSAVSFLLHDLLQTERSPIALYFRPSVHVPFSLVVNEEEAAKLKRTRNGLIAYSISRDCPDLSTMVAQEILDQLASTFPNPVVVREALKIERDIASLIVRIINNPNLIKVIETVHHALRQLPKDASFNEATIAQRLKDLSPE